MYSYKTRDLKQAAFLWCQLKYPVTFKGVEPLPRSANVVLFVFELQATEKQIQEMLFEYTNEQTCVEPNSYNSKIKKLLDSVSNLTGGKR